MTWLDTFRSGKARRRNLVGVGGAVATGSSHVDASLLARCASVSQGLDTAEYHELSAGGFTGSGATATFAGTLAFTS